MKTIGIKLSREQAIHLARVLLAASQEWRHIDVTAYRFHQRKSDESYQVTVTSFRDVREIPKTIEGEERFLGFAPAGGR